MPFSLGRNSPSFVIAVAALGVAIVAYLAWSFLRPNPYAMSEQIVRDFVATVSGDVREFRREVRAVTAKARGKPEKAEAVLARIEELQDAATDAIDEHANEAIDELLELDIRLRTQRNRRGRIRGRADEAIEMVADLAEEARDRLRGD